MSSLKEIFKLKSFNADTIQLVSFIGALILIMFTAFEFGSNAQFQNIKEIIEAHEAKNEIQVESINHKMENLNSRIDDQYRYIDLICTDKGKKK